jgi:NTP pyrophosphatase (non-canonical NTP hydrolase)
VTAATPSEDRLAAIRDRLRRFVADRDWQQFHDPKNLAMAIASEAGELLAELRWVASSRADEAVEDPAKRERLGGEAADIAISLLLFCDRAGIDLLSAIEDKIGQNEGHYPVAESRGKSDRPRPEPSSSR